MNTNLVDSIFNNTQNNTQQNDVIGYNEKDFYFWNKYNTEIASPLPTFSTFLTDNSAAGDTTISIDNIFPFQKYMVVQIISDSKQDSATIVSVNLNDYKLTFDRPLSNSYISGATVNVYSVFDQPNLTPKLTTAITKSSDSNTKTIYIDDVTGIKPGMFIQIIAYDNPIEQNFTYTYTSKITGITSTTGTTTYTLSLQDSYANIITTANTKLSIDYTTGNSITVDLLNVAIQSNIYITNGSNSYYSSVSVAAKNNLTLSEYLTTTAKYMAGTPVNVRIDGISGVNIPVGTIVNIYNPVQNCILLKNNLDLQTQCQKSSKNLTEKQNEECYQMELCKNRDNYIQIKKLEGTFTGGYHGKDGYIRDTYQLYNFNSVTFVNLSLGIIFLGLLGYAVYKYKKNTTKN